MTPLFSFAVACGVFACAALLLAVYRKMIARKEDDNLHVLDSGAALVARQQIVASRLEVVDRWGKTITVLAVVFGILAGVLALVAAWQSSQQLPG